MQFLRDEACAEVQGYAIGRPAPSGTLGEWTERAAEAPRVRGKRRSA